jgi:hypothetical protein
MELWLWTLTRLQKATDAEGAKLFHGTRQGVTFPLADALCWLLASRCQILDVLELERRGPEHAVVAEGIAGLVGFLTDLCHVQAARAAGEVGRICAELVFGYNRHPAWEGASCETSGQAGGGPARAGAIPVISGSPKTDFNGFDPYQPKGPKAGPCCSFEGLEEFLRLRLRLDGCLTGARLAKDRAAAALTTVMIPEALDYPQ